MPLIKYKCQYCNKVFLKPDWRKSKYCNRKCFYLDRIGKLYSEETKKKMSEIRKGIKFSNEHLKNLSLSHKGYKHPISQKKKLSESLKKAWKEGKFDLRKQIPWNKGKECPQLSKEKHPNWKGGISPRDTSSLRYKNWRKAIFEYDNYTCWICEEKKSGSFVAHHLKGWKKYPELRYKVSNGIMICKKCHYLYGNHLDKKLAGDKFLRDKK